MSSVSKRDGRGRSICLGINTIPSVSIAMHISWLRQHHHSDALGCPQVLERSEHSRCSVTNAHLAIAVRETEARFVAFEIIKFLLCLFGSFDASVSPVRHHTNAILGSRCPCPSSSRSAWLRASSKYQVAITVTLDVAVDHRHFDMAQRRPT